MAASIVAQGIRIRLGRSLVTITGIVLGIAFLVSSLGSSALRRGVAEEDRRREEANRMYGYLVAETGGLAGRSLVVWAAGELGPRFQCGAVGHAEQEVGQLLSRTDRPGSPGEDDEHRLEGVVGVRGVADHPPTDAVHHRPVPADDGLERRRVAVADEGGEQLGVGLRQVADGNAAERGDQPIGKRTGRRRHGG